MASIPEGLRLGGFSEGDDDIYSWSTRVNKGANQWLLDLQAEWQLPNKAQVIRLVIGFAHNYLFKEISELQGKGMDPETQHKYTVAREFHEAECIRAEREYRLGELRNRLMMIEKEHDPALANLLLNTAKGYAEIHGVPWPPPDMALTAYDDHARYIMERILSVSNQGDDRISLSHLLRNCTGKKREVLPAVERLRDHGYITIEEEVRSGPPTIWIEVVPLGRLDRIRKMAGEPTSAARNVAKSTEMGKDDPF